MCTTYTSKFLYDKILFNITVTRVRWTEAHASPPPLSWSIQTASCLLLTSSLELIGKGGHRQNGYSWSSGILMPAQTVARAAPCYIPHSKQTLLAYRHWSVSVIAQCLSSLRSVSYSSVPIVIEVCQLQLSAHRHWGLSVTAQCPPSLRSVSYSSVPTVLSGK